jgi:hypothetical protein
MRVSNINGISDNACTCGSWLKHWEKFSGQALTTYCPQVTCVQKPAVGAHVQRGNSGDSNWYIVPLCTAHNGKKGQSLDISDKVILVSVNVSNTCGK